MAERSPGTGSSVMITSDTFAVSDPRDDARALLEQLPAARLGLAKGAAVHLASPIARYRVSADDLRPRSDLANTAYRWGWRFYLVSDHHLLPFAVDLRPGRDAGSWRAGLASGVHLARQLTLIDRLARDARIKRTLRILDAPGLDWSGLWVVGTEEQLISLESGRKVDPARLLTQLRRTASQQRMAAILSRVDQPKKRGPP